MAAVTEIIKEKEGKESEIEYFAALMTGMDSVKGNEDSTAAFLYLIALAIKKYKQFSAFYFFNSQIYFDTKILKRIPEIVLRAKYLQLLNTLIQPLIDFGEKSSNVTLIKSVGLKFSSEF